VVAAGDTRLGASVADGCEGVVVYEVYESEAPDGSVPASGDAEMVVHRARIAREEALGSRSSRSGR